MEAKQGRPGGFFPDGMMAAAMKRLRALSLAVLRDATAASGCKPCIEMVLRFVVHLPLRKRPKVFTEEETRPIAPEDEVAKIIAALILREMDSWVASSQWAYQAGRSAGEAARLMAMILDEARETTGRATLYKRDRSNAYGTVDLSGVAYLLRRQGVQPQAARWYRRYLQQVRAISITAAGVSRAWRFKIGLFQGSPLSPRVYLYQEKVYMEAVGPEDRGFPPFPTSTGQFWVATEHYSDDAVVVGVTEEFMVWQLRRYDEVAPRYRVCHVLEKEEYLSIQWDARGKASSGVLQDRHYGKTTRRTVRQGLRVLGCQVYQGAFGVQAHRAVRGAVEMWSAAPGPGSTVKDMARVYQEQVASQVAVQAQAVSLSEKIREGRVQDGGPGGQDMEEASAPACVDGLFHAVASIGQGAARQAPAHSGA